MRYDWEEDLTEWDAGDEDASSNEEEDTTNTPPQGEGAGDLLAEFLLTLNLEGKLSATSLCIIAYWAERSGAKGRICKFAYRPDAGSSKFQRHVDTVLGIRTKDLVGTMYHMRTPGLAKYDFSRTPHNMPVNLPHECLIEEVSQTPSLLEAARAKTKNKEWPETFVQHPVVQRAGTDIVIPIALYMDGISMTRNDGIFGLFCYSLLSMRRHLIAVFRKSFMCKCGCGGRCTLVPLWALLHWSLSALAEGRWPSQKHDGTAWTRADGSRGSQAGKRMPFRACVLQIKADWAEFSKTLGFSSWASSLYPCPLCRLTKEELYSVEGFGPLGCPWPLLRHEDMERAAAACEIWVELDRDEHKSVVQALDYEKSKTGPRGRGLVKDFPKLGLRRGDRLEPHPGMLDVAEFDSILTFPTRALFWRRDAETRVQFRNQLWDPDGLGISIGSLAIDTLHTVYLGPVVVFLSFALWLLVDSDFWGLGRNKSKDSRWQANLQHLRTQMRKYYSDRRRAQPQRPVTEVEDLTVNILGGKKGALANFKAAESKRLLPFVLGVLRVVPRLDDGLRAQLVGAGEALVEFSRCIDDSPMIMQPGVIQAMHESYKRYMKLSAAAGVPMKPKNHLFGHLVNRAITAGNPKMYSTFDDEGLNAVVKRMGIAAHRMVWEYRMYNSFAQWESNASAKRRRY